MQPIETSHPVQTKLSKRTKVALWLMIGPTALIIVSLMAHAIINIVMGVVPPDQDPSQNPNLFISSETTVASMILSALFSLIGVVSFLAWLPGLITGIVLLATKKPTHHA